MPLFRLASITWPVKIIALKKAEERRDSVKLLPDPINTDEIRLSMKCQRAAPVRTLQKLAEVLSRHSHASEWIQSTVVPSLNVFRADQSTARTPGIYEPLFCLVVSGHKEVFLGGRTYKFGSGDCFLITLNLPVIGTISRASPKNPYIALCFNLRPTSLVESEGTHDAFQMGQTSAEITEAALRLARLLDHPEHIEVLAPLYERELLYRLYMGPWGPALRDVTQTHSRLSQIAKAIAWLHEHYAAEYSASVLAGIAGMSVSSMNRHFRQVTALSPLEYQKRIRLQEARRLLITRSTDVAGAGYVVGYSSATQFNREYRRLFGLPPGRDTGRKG